MKKQSLAVCLIVLACVIAFANSLGNGFVYDDNPFITDNTAIRSLANIPSFFVSIKSFSPAATFYIYRPLSTLSYALDYSLSGLNPATFHLSSLIWHIMACIMMYFTLGLILKDRAQSLFATLLFSVHPAQVESVAWVAQRSNLISLFFFLLAFYSWVRGKTFYTLSAVCYLLALLGKEMAITLPLVLILYDGFFQPKADKGLAGVVGVKWKRYLPFLIVAAFYIILRTAVLGRMSGQNEFAGGSLYAASLTMFRVILFYMRLFLLPVKLCADYDFSAASSMGDIRIILSLLSVILLVCAGGVLFAKRKKEGFFILFFIITILPVSNLIPLQGIIAADRFMYFPVTGFCCILSMFIARTGKTNKIILVSLIIACYACLTVNRNRDWKNALTLWSATVKEAPSNYRAYGNLGVAYGQFGYHDRAVESFRQAIRLRNDYEKAYCGLGIACTELGQYPDAIEFLTEAVRMKPDYANAYYNLGLAYAAAGELSKAVESFAQAAILVPSYADAYYGMGVACARMGNKEEAMKQYEILKNMDKGMADELLYKICRKTIR